ncbi:MAG: ribonuclease HII, partial [Gordonia sp. (in: high G+C Gram-positive bacteria)]|uniref:ribonuclease HII n=1 Tax=Gordonia sp. (in: high G+C Gram-positive bacteria) TaxID=84139 RepID=UPI003BB6895D
VRKAASLRTLEFTLQRNGLGPVAGVDEAGRGACAGPLVVAACVLTGAQLKSLADLDDSKKLSEATRERLYAAVVRHAVDWSVVAIEADEIDRIGVHVANLRGMRQAVAGLSVRPGYVLSDGFAVPGLPAPSLPVIGGDANAACIAAASVLAKVTRDRIMVGLDAAVPGYDFAVHKGYGTAHHMDCLDRIGPSRQHRMSYRNVRDRLV